MPRATKPTPQTYEVSVTRTLTLITRLEVEAASEEEAEEHAQEAAAKGLLTWDIKDDLDWQEDSDDVTVDSLDEV